MQQVSVFAENQRGMMERITGVLRSEDINILGSVTNDSAEYGIVRMVVSNPSAAVDALTKAGLLCHLTEVVGVELMDEVGNLNQLLQALSESNISGYISAYYLHYSLSSFCLFSSSKLLLWLATQRLIITIPTTAPAIKHPIPTKIII